MTRAKITTMPESDFETVDDYIQAKSTAAQGILYYIRRTIRKAIPSDRIVRSLPICTGHKYC